MGIIRETFSKYPCQGPVLRSPDSECPAGPWTGGFWKKTSQGFWSSAHPGWKFHGVQDDSLRYWRKILELVILFSITSFKKTLLIYINIVYDNAIRKSQIHIFRLPLQSFWSHFLTITYQHKLSVVGLILLKEQKRSRIFCPEKEV